MTRGRAKQYGHLEEEWVRLYVEEGLTYTKIAELYHVQSETVSRYIKPYVLKKSNQNVKTWLKEYQNGQTFTEIARRYSVSETKVKTHVYKEITPILEDLKYTWVALYKKGKSLKSIGEAYHFHPKIIFNVIKDEVKLRCQDDRKVYEMYIENWVRLYQEGFSFCDIAKKFEVSTDTVYRNIKDKVTVRNRKTSKEKIKQLVPMWRALYYREKLTLKEISEKYDIAPSTIYKYVKKAE